MQYSNKNFIFVANYQSLRANCYHKIRLYHYLASLGDRRKVVFIDELPWFDTPRSNFISAIELFWNQWASDQNLMLVVCGSATSWMVNKLLGDKGGLHNRVTRSIYLAPFSLGETEEFLQNNHIVFNRHQIVECYMMLGGTPYYLNMLKLHQELHWHGRNFLDRHH